MFVALCVSLKSKSRFLIGDHTDFVTSTTKEMKNPKIDFFPYNASMHCVFGGSFQNGRKCEFAFRTSWRGSCWQFTSRIDFLGADDRAVLFLFAARQLCQREHAGTKNFYEVTVPSYMPEDFRSHFCMSWHTVIIVENLFRSTPIPHYTGNDLFCFSFSSSFLSCVISFKSPRRPPTLVFLSGNFVFFNLQPEGPLDSYLRVRTVLQSRCIL